MSDRSNAQIIAEARRQIAKYDDWHLSRPWIEELQGQIAYGIASDAVAALRAVVAALEAEGRLTPSAQPVTDAEIEAAQVAFHEFVFGYEEPLTRRDKGVTRQAWRVALEAARQATGWRLTPAVQGDAKLLQNSNDDLEYYGPDWDGQS